MKSFFQSLDLYKVIIFGSLILLPGVGFWAYHLQGELERGRTAIHNATKDRGDLTEIGKYQKAVDEQRRNRSRDGGKEGYTNYFQANILTGAKLKSTDFHFGTAQERRVGNRALDTEVPIVFDKIQLRRDQILSILFNCESQSPVWKLRDLKIRNEASRGGARGRTPPPELEDSWRVDRMVFASRRPNRG